MNKPISLFTVEEKVEAYGELGMVKLTPSEYKKLCDKLGEGLTNEFITDLDLYIAGNKNAEKYKKHYAVILTWVRKKTQDFHTSRLQKGKNIVGL
jgi:hypothetical protein